VTRPPGSCPTDAVAAAVELADGLRSADLHGDALCRLLTPGEERSARDQAAQPHVSCNEAALFSALDGSNISPRQRFSHLARMLIISASSGPPQWFVVLSFKQAGAPVRRGDPSYGAFNVTLSKLATGRWAISHIGYQF
jgi:hypothetical protein